MSPPFRILMTGGAGYVGSACFRAFRRRGIEAFVVDDLSEGNADAVEADRLHRLDVRETDALARLMRDLRIDSVAHFAGLVSVAESLQRPDAYWSVNFSGTQSVLAAMLDAGVSRLVFSSTAAVYDPGTDGPLTENAPLAPITPYGASKLAAEYLIRDVAQANGLKAVALRYFNACGADEDGAHGEARRRETHIVPLIFESALGKREMFRIFGTDRDTDDGTCVRDYVGLPDLAEAHLAALTRDLSDPFTPLNLGSGRGTSVRSLFDMAQNVVGRPIPNCEAPRRPGDPDCLVADISRARAVLGWEPRASEPDQFLAAAWRWHASHPEGYQKSIGQEAVGEADSDTSERGRP